MKFLNFFYFCGSFLPSWIRIRIPNPDPQPRVSDFSGKFSHLGYGCDERNAEVQAARGVAEEVRQARHQRRKRPDRFTWGRCSGHSVFVISVTDPGCLSRILSFSIPDSHQRIKYFNPKKWFQSSQKLDLGCSSRIRILNFLPISDPGSRGAKGTESRIRIRNTGYDVVFHSNRRVF